VANRLALLFIILILGSKAEVDQIKSKH